MPVRVKRDHVLYDEFVRTGLMQTTPGNAIHYAFIEKFIIDLSKKYNIKEIAFDRWGSEMLIQNLTEAGLTVVDFGQG